MSREQTLEQYMLEHQTDVSNSTDTIIVLGELVQEAKGLEEEILLLKEQLERSEKQLKHVLEKQIPDLMETAELSMLKVTSGETVSLEKKIRAHIKEENQEVAYEWLREHNYEYLLKRVLKLQFDAGKDEEAQRAKELIESNFEGLGVEDKVSIHPSTLAAFVKELVEEGIEIPSEPFGIFEQKFAKIAKPKEKKSKKK